MRGLVEVFTGNGRGKTTAALGVALRALGHGLRVCVIYFMKGDFPYGEQKALSQLANLSFTRFGREGFIEPTNLKPEDSEQAAQALRAARQAVLDGKYDLVVLDEVNLAVAWKLVDVADVIELIKQKPDNVEIILTGRYADNKLIELADLVTEMVEVKHPYTEGVLARRGIDY